MRKRFKDWVMDNKVIIIILSLVILIPICLNLFTVFGYIKTGTGLGNAEWLGFWGSFLGGAATLTAVYLTLKQNSKVIKANEKLLNFQEERARLSLMPILDVIKDHEISYESRLQSPNIFLIVNNESSVDVIDSISMQDRYSIGVAIYEEKSDGSEFAAYSTANFLGVKVTQKGPSTAMNVQIFICHSDKKQILTPTIALMTGESVSYGLFFTKNSPLTEYNFGFAFTDIEGRSYEQTFTVGHEGYTKTKLVPISNPVLNEPDKEELPKT